MGHLVNPISFRLGYTQFWKSQWYASTSKNYITKLKEDFMLYNFINSFFKYAKLLKKRRNAVIKIKYNYIKLKKITKLKKKKKRIRLRPSQRKKIRINRYSLNNFIKKFSLVFSHSNVIRFGNKINLNINFYDGALEQEKARFSNSLIRLLETFSNEYSVRNIISRFNDRSKLRYFNQIRNFNFFYFLHKIKPKTKSNLSIIFSENFGKKKKKKKLKFKLNGYRAKKLINLKIKNRYIFNKNLLQLNKLTRNRKDYNLRKNRYNKNLNVLLNYIIPLKFKSFKLLKLKKIIKLIKCFWLFFNYNSKNLLKRIFILRTILFCCLYLKKKINIFIKKIISKRYNKDNLKKILTLKNKNKSKNRNKKNRLNFFRYKKVEIKKLNKKLFNLNFNSKNKSNLLYKLMKELNKLNKFLFFITNITAKNTFDYSRKKMYKKRYNFWFYISRILFENIKNIFVIKNNIISFNYFGLTNLTPTASFIANYISKKINQKYTINEVLKPISKDLSRNFAIQGFKFCCAGRLTKKQRASFIVQKEKKVPTNTLESSIDYATSTVKLRHGVSGIKVWITRKKSYRFFEYNFNFVYSY